MTRRVVSSIADTRAAAAAFTSLLRPGDVVLLVGDLGAGKTAFTQGVAAALGVRERVTSPTFTLAHPYATASAMLPRLWHVDLYRTSSLGEVWDLGLDEELAHGAIAIIEWGDLAPEAFGRPALVLTIEVTGYESRTLSVTTKDPERDGEVHAWGNS